MPINQEQAREYARRFNEDPEFQRALQTARRNMEYRHHDNATVFYTDSAGEDLDTGGDRLSIHRLHLSREDMRRIDQALIGNQPEPRSSRDNVWDELFQYATRTSRWTGMDMPTQSIPRQTTNTQADFYQAIVGVPTGHLAELSATTLTIDDLYTELIQPEPDRRETTTMEFAIPHPLAEFDEHSRMLFTSVMEYTNPYIAKAGNGLPDYDHRLRVLHQQKHLLKSRPDLVASITIPDRGIANDEGVPSLSWNDSFVGLPIFDSPPDPNNANACALYTIRSGQQLVRYSSTNENNVPIGRPYNRAPRYGSNFDLSPHEPIGYTPIPVTDYFHLEVDPVETVQEAWDRCSGSWKTWAMNCAIGPDIALWHAMIYCPQVFGLSGAEAMWRLWGDIAVHERGRTLALARATFNPDDKTLTLARTPKDAVEGKLTTMRVGKALKLLNPEWNDERVKTATADLVGRLTPPEFRIGFEKADFDLAYTKGPSSCMTYQRDRYHLLKHTEGDNRPTDAYLNGDIGVAMMIAGDRVTARTLVVESTKKYIRLYSADYSNEINGSRALAQKLRELGYHEDSNGLIGQKLVKIDLNIDREAFERRLEGIYLASEEYLLRALREHHNFGRRLNRDQELEFLRIVNPRAYLAPFVDHGGYVLEDGGDHLLVTHSTQSSLQHTYHGLARVLDGQYTANRGRPYYEGGGAVIGDYVTAAAYVNQLQAEAEQAEAAQRPAEAPPVPPQVPVQPVENPNATCYREQIQAYALRTNGGYRVYNPVSRTLEDLWMTVEERHAFNEDFPGMDLTLVEHPYEELVWCPDNNVSCLADDDEVLFITDLADDYGYVFCEDADGWYDKDYCIRLRCGNWEPDGSDVVVFVECWDEYAYEDDDDICYVDRHSEYWPKDRCVVTTGDEYELASECFQLPDGDYIHEDDLNRAA